MQYPLAMLTALANALASVLQRKAAGQEPDVRSLSPALIWDLLHRPTWLAGLMFVVAGFLLQATALDLGSLVVVQPLMICDLPLSLLLARPILHSRLGRQEWVAIMAMAGGLAVLLVAGAPTPDRGLPSDAGWLFGGIATVALIGLLVLCGRRASGAARAALLGVAAGSTFGLTAALMKGTTWAFERGPAAGFTAWETYGMVLCGVGAMFLLQSAFQAGRLTAAQPGITISDPLVSGAWGLLLFGERLRGGLATAGELAGAGLIVAGVVLLLRSPYLRGEAGRSEQAEPGGGNG